MTRPHDIHLRSDGSIDIDYYRRAAAEERAKALRLTYIRVGAALAPIIRGPKDFLSRRAVLRGRTLSPAGR